MKLDWNVEETSRTPKKRVDWCCSKPDALKLPAQLKSTKRRRGCTVLLGFHICSDSALNRNQQVSDLRIWKTCVVCGAKTQAY